VNCPLSDFHSRERAKGPLRSSAAAPENATNRSCTTDSATESMPPTDEGIESRLRSERLQRQRWIAYLARQIANDILRDTPVKEDGDHD
jgi:hypothetical protein